MDLPAFLFQSWDNAFNQTYFLYERMKQDKYIPEVIVGIARGGWIPSRLLADFFGISLILSVKLEFYTKIGQNMKQPKIVQPLNVDIKDKSVLLVDDIADSGKSLNLALEHIKKQHPRIVKTLTLYYKPHSIIKPDYYYESTKAWVVFPWEYHEFMNELHDQLAREMSEQDVQNWFKQIGVPAPIVNSYYLNLRHNNKT